MQEEQGAVAPCNRTRIMRFPVCEQVDVVALGFAHHRRGVFSVLLYHKVSSLCSPVFARGARMPAARREPAPHKARPGLTNLSRS